MSSGCPCLTEEQVQDLQDEANKMRIHAVEMTEAAKSGHPSSSASAAEVVSVLFFNEMRYDCAAPKHASSDRFVLSKGHACPILYAAWCEAGLLSEEKVKTLRRFDSDLEGHPTPRQNYIDVATGSLGQGLSIAAGMAYCGKYLDKASYRVYCLMGDGETAEGSVWEAAAFSSYYKLDNLVAIVDVNRLGQSQVTSLMHDLETYRKRFDGFGFNAIVVDGHDIQAIHKALHSAKTTKGKPTALLCQTLKGKGFPDVENKDNWHGKALGPKEAQKAYDACNAAIKKKDRIKFDLPKVNYNETSPVTLKVSLSEPPNYKLGAKIATRKAYGDALLKLGKSNPRVVALDGDTKNSTFAITYRDYLKKTLKDTLKDRLKEGLKRAVGDDALAQAIEDAVGSVVEAAVEGFIVGILPGTLKDALVGGLKDKLKGKPEGAVNGVVEDALKDSPEDVVRRFVECFIAEQNMVGVGTGLACRGRNIVFCSAFAAFFTRAFDQIRMGAISHLGDAPQTKVNYVGSHSGCSIGEDGPSQMALEDIAMFRTIPDSVCFYPSDAVATERAIELAANETRITFTRTSRPETEVIYKNDEQFVVGKAKVVKQSEEDKVTVVGVGVTLYEALKAYEALAKENIKIRVVDPFTVKPIDKETLIACAKATNGNVVVVEDHYAEGGVGEAVAAALSEERNVRVRRLAVTGVPRSGLCDELLEEYGISSKHVIHAVKDLIR